MFSCFKYIFYPKKVKHYLFTTYYLPTCEKRKAEYDFCINKNKAASFDKIFLFVEEKDLQAASLFGVNLILTKNRPTFEDYFGYIKANNFNDSINVLANTDIFFLNMNQIDKNIRRLKKGESCFALSRYEFEPGRPSYLFDRSDSQDAWIFNGCEGLEKIKFVDFSMGIPGCDNRLAFELNKAAFLVLNPSKSIHSFHMHNVPNRTYLEDSVLSVPPPYHYLVPTR
jgi:hypothetical protein